MRSATRRWHLVTGEYPPQPGGVADYTRQLAQGLAATGDKVIVWAPQTQEATAHDERVVVRCLPGHFGPSALAELDAELARWPGRVLLQYVPHAFGCKAMNVPLCAWLWARPRRLDVMFHEVAYPFVAGQPLKHRALASVHRVMASLLLRSAERVFVSTPGWESLLKPLASRYPSPIWTPVPSNLPLGAEPQSIEQIRGRFPRANCRLVGHFGTYGAGITKALEPALREILAGGPDIHCLLLGHGSREFADGLERKDPMLAGRLTALGPLESAAAAAHIAACDLLVQPYPDGISARRGSAMAALALGCAIVTNAGQWTEPIWGASDAVELAPLDQLGAAGLAILSNPPRRRGLGRRGANLYRERFALDHTIRAVRAVWSATPASPTAAVAG